MLQQKAERSKATHRPLNVNFRDRAILPEVRRDARREGRGRRGGTKQRGRR